ncbi:hypothetical protein QO002_001108 [Pararhizobium capsulatum DSM 1112]|uniref:Uncharacterized protein n=1 Tax=Pararhizobium capsulatum DSM 1112 TaxID=1121113 RepID=A0ABU0BL50_9HYPH|nr:hypothetical protein [Pararhizobium capsulatum DSM 1112]
MSRNGCRSVSPGCDQLLKTGKAVSADIMADGKAYTFGLKARDAAALAISSLTTWATDSCGKRKLEIRRRRRGRGEGHQKADRRGRRIEIVPPWNGPAGLPGYFRLPPKWTDHQLARLDGRRCCSAIHAGCQPVSLRAGLRGDGTRKCRNRDCLHPRARRSHQVGGRLASRPDKANRGRGIGDRTDADVTASRKQSHWTEGRLMRDHRRGGQRITIV